MANQPTKYRKFVVGAASAALVASAVAPVAFAADFSDTKGNTHEEAINALSEAGVIKGYEDGTFKPNKTLTRSDVVKLMGKWLVSEGYKVPADAQSKPRFADLKSTSNKELLEMAAVVYDNGVFVGTPDGKLDPTGDITRENMAIVLVRAFDRVHDIDLASYVADQDFKKDVTDLGKAKAEARPAIDVLDFFDITNPAAPEFNPKATTTRGHFATFLHKTINADFSDVEGGVVAPGVASVKAVNATTVEVTMKDKVDNINSLNFTIDGLTVSNAAVKQSDDKTVVLTTAAQKGGEKYTVNLDGKAIGTFTGMSAVVPTKVSMTTDNVQGKVGQQVILTADVGVKEAGVPVTFNVKAQTQTTLNKDQVFETTTNAEGLATFSYTQYAAGQDEVVVYPTGAPTVRDYATVNWGVDSILTLEEDDKKGTSLNNGENKVYKVTYKDPKTGKPVANETLNVTFKENVDVAVNKLTDATINGKKAHQTTNGDVSAVTVTTDSKGEATFTVSGTNTKATPVVFADGSGYSNNKIDSKLDRTELQVAGKELTFAAVHEKYAIEVTRDGSEEAATGLNNGRKYKVAVKDENGKAAAGEVVNVAFDEVLDRVISTNTKAQFIIDNDDLKGTTTANGSQQVSIQLDGKGEAEFKIATATANNKDYATPVVWIDINSSSNKDGNLEQGEPTQKAGMTYFVEEKIQESKLAVYNKANGLKVSSTNPLKDTDVAEFRLNVANQSGEAFAGSVKSFKATYQVTNQGTNDVYVWTDASQVGDLSKATTISTRRGETFTVNTTAGAKQVELYVGSNGKTANVDVTAYGDVTDSQDKVIRLAESKVAKASFQANSDLGTSYTGLVGSINVSDKKIKFLGKEELNYKAEFDADKVKYESAVNGTTLNLNAAQFEKYLTDNPNSNVHYFKGSDGVITFTILNAPAEIKTDADIQKLITAAGNKETINVDLTNATGDISITEATKELTFNIKGNFGAHNLTVNAPNSHVNYSGTTTGTVTITDISNSSFVFAKGAGATSIAFNDTNGGRLAIAEGATAPTVALGAGANAKLSGKLGTVTTAGAATIALENATTAITTLQANGSGAVSVTGAAGSTVGSVEGSNAGSVDSNVNPETTNAVLQSAEYTAKVDKVDGAEAVAAKATVGGIDFEAVTAGTAGNDLKVVIEESVEAVDGTNQPNKVEFAENTLTVTIGSTWTDGAAVKNTLTATEIQESIDKDATAKAAIKATAGAKAEKATSTNLTGGKAKVDAVEASNATLTFTFSEAVTLPAENLVIKTADKTATVAKADVTVNSKTVVAKLANEDIKTDSTITAIEGLVTAKGNVKLPTAGVKVTAK
ncbi:S-layer homology domain-containing protein [Sporosarcina newyorkensis]|uniref:S-layer homology domain-containing protein n=1 Tax=Sporosarcina newyorkensis TaxID=759851 RepID=A0A1T4XZ36_9BACL|nr:S-layer homology domain-containing protein [Sporosarcina newyorkensis]SKA94295.1 S-layer homology domain-containing protein [Sporosarcina newyorkensis]